MFCCSSAKVSINSESVKLFVIIMSICGKHIDMNLCFKNPIYEPMLFCYLATPTPFWFSFQRFWMACSRLGMNFKFLDKTTRFSKSFRLTPGKALQIQGRLRHDNNLICHTRFVLKKPTSLLLATFPFPHHVPSAAPHVLSWQKTLPCLKGWGLFVLLPTWPSTSPIAIVSEQASAGQSVKPGYN